MSRPIAVAILGGTGFGAGELLRLLAAHNQVDVVSVVSSSQSGAAISAAHSHLAGFYEELSFDAELPLERFSGYQHQFVFAALPHGKSAEGISALLARSGAERIRVIDLSGDFRLKNPETRAKFYGSGGDSKTSAASTSPESLSVDDFVYGLTELNRVQIANAKHVANPGCLASGCALAVLPLIGATWTGSIIFDAKTGTSGAGKTPQESMHHPLRNSSMTAYKVLEHRHEPEIRETLGDVSGTRIETAFVPHLLPASRGIYATAYLTLDKEALEKAADSDSLFRQYEEYYANSPFVRVRRKPPELSDVVGSNFCDVAVFARGRQVVALAALDNLVKGMAGQAIQNLNVMSGLSEVHGLWASGLGPF